MSLLIKNVTLLFECINYELIKHRYNTTTQRRNRDKNTPFLWRPLANSINFFMFHNVYKWTVHSHAKNDQNFQKCSLMIRKSAIASINLAHPVELCWRCVMCMKDRFSKGVSWFADSLQFDHHVNIRHTIPRVGSGAIPGRGEGWGWHEEPACVKPPAAALHHCAVVHVCVVVHIQRRKFHPVVRHHQKRMSEAQQIVDATDSTTQNIVGYILAFQH